jgi:DNA-binding response OmpR family regulator
VERVLIIEDRRDVAHAVADVLEDEGFHVSVAYDGQSGLEQFEQAHPDVVILDLMLPDMHGFQVFRSIRGIRDVPIVMLTAKSDLSDRLAGIELGADEYVVKPFSVDELLARVRVVLHRARPSTDPAATGSGPSLGGDCPEVI